MLMYINVVNILHPLTHFPFMVFLALKPPSYSEISKALSFISLMLYWSGQLNTSNGLYSYLFLKSIPWSCVRWLWGIRMLWRSTFQTYLGSGGSYKYVPTFKSLCYLEDALPMINIYIFCFYSQEKILLERSIFIQSNYSFSGLLWHSIFYWNLLFSDPILVWANIYIQPNF